MSTCDFTQAAEAVRALWQKCPETDRQRLMACFAEAGTLSQAPDAVAKLDRLRLDLESAIVQWRLRDLRHCVLARRLGDRLAQARIEWHKASEWMGADELGGLLEAVNKDLGPFAHVNADLGLRMDLAYRCDNDRVWRLRYLRGLSVAVGALERLRDRLSARNEAHIVADLGI